MMAELVAERTQEGAKRGDFVSNRRPHPHANEQRFGMVIAEKLECAALSNPERSRRQYADAAVGNFVEI